MDFFHNVKYNLISIAAPRKNTGLSGRYNFEVKMKISDVVAVLGCEVLCGEENLDQDVSSACGADLMSDALAFAKEHAVLLTGMVNQHVIRTAQMLDLYCIVFVRGKQPPEEILELAKDTGITLLTCERSLYESCGLLYTSGLIPCSRL